MAEELHRVVLDFHRPPGLELPQRRRYAERRREKIGINELTKEVSVFKEELSRARGMNKAGFYERFFSAADRISNILE